MSVYKEIVIGLEKIQRESKQIYNDACDYGVPVMDEANDPLMNQIQGLIDQYGFEVEKNAELKQVTIKAEWLDEWNGGGEESCDIIYTRIDRPNHPSLNVRGIKGFISLN
jgi:hypothetical protein